MALADLGIKELAKKDKVTDDVIEDIVSVSNLVPLSPAPQIGDVVVFNTQEATYIGTVKQKQKRYCFNRNC